jgi:hypothetical protein
VGIPAAKKLNQNKCFLQHSYLLHSSDIGVNLALTPTAKKLLQLKALSSGCKSLSDYLEKLARDSLK